jgi:hypothetical protein
MTLLGIVQNFAGLTAARFFLGLAEAGLYVSALLAERWYQRETEERTPKTKKSREPIL